MMIKELSVIDVNTWVVQLWIFKHSSDSPLQNSKTRSVNKWLEQHYNHIPLDYGDVRYEELDRILNSLKFDHAKGEQKQGLIFEFIPHVNAVNTYRAARLPAIGSIDTYPAMKIEDRNTSSSSTSCCIFH